MRFLRRLQRNPAPAAGDAESTTRRTRYDIAREGYEIRVGELARALDQSALKNYLSSLANISLGIGIVMIALEGGVRPIFIPYDQFGRVIRYDDMSRLKKPPRQLVESELIEWLVNVRGIYLGDPIAQLERARAAKPLLTPESEQWLAQYFADPTRNPANLLRDRSRTVNVQSISKDPDRSLWYVQWREVEIPARGAYVESAWQGTFKLDFVQGNTEESVWANPAGIRIVSIEWNRVRERVSSPSRPTQPDSALARTVTAVPMSSDSAPR